MLREPITLEFPVIAEPPRAAELPTEDGIPMESPWHRAEINLLIDSLDQHWRGRTDYYCGGNMFIYFSLQQIRKQDYRGPDFFVVKGVDGTRPRGSWVVWEEDGQYPDLIVELLSPSTAELDKTTKKQLYENVFHTPEYFCYDPAPQELLGWHLAESQYEELIPDPSGRLWSNILKVWMGLWEGEYLGHKAHWLRFFDDDGNLIPINTEAQAARADREAARAESEAARADREAARATAAITRADQEAAARQTAEVELIRLRAELARLQNP